MHISDALISPAVGGTMLAVSAAAIGYSAFKIKKTEHAENTLPLMGVMGAFVFAAQMVNFTIPATGSSGHICGGILLAAVLGEFPAIIALSAVLIIQCLLFADGGLLALGCNIFNMCVVPCLFVYPLVFKPFLKKSITPKRLCSASVSSAVIALQLGSFAVVLETLCSGVTALPFKTFVLFMQPIHLVIGIFEGVITSAVLCFVFKARPEIFNSSLKGKKSMSVLKFTLTIALCALFVGGILSICASSLPDGLEWSVAAVTDGAGVETPKTSVHRAFDNIQKQTAIMPDYDYKTAHSGNATSFAGILGGVAVTAFSLICGAAIKFYKKVRKS